MEEKQSNGNMAAENLGLRFDSVHVEIVNLRDMIDVKLDAIIKQTTKTNGLLIEHDGRIKSLENWRWYVIGIATILGMAIYEVLSRI